MLSTQSRSESQEPLFEKHKRAFDHWAGHDVDSGQLPEQQTVQVPETR